MGNRHILKMWDGDQHFQAVLDKRKTFDVRVNDRRPRYAVNDTVLFKECSHRGYTGREIEKKIIFMQPGYEDGFIPPWHGIRAGYVGLGLGDIDDTNKA